VQDIEQNDTLWDARECKSRLKLIRIEKGKFIKYSYNKATIVSKNH
jgi:hypothetical protein